MIRAIEGGDGIQVPDISKGTECGRIISTDRTLIGRRVVHEEHFGTIRYVGALPNSNGVWLGVDWDNPDRGRHDGSYRGHQYFKTEHESSGSFVRPAKVSLGTSLEEALVFRYVLCTECQLSTRQLISNPSKTENSGSSVPLQDCFFHSRELTNANVVSVAEHKELEYSGPFLQSVQIELFTSPSKVSGPSHHEKCGPDGVQNALQKLRSASLPLIPIYRALATQPNVEKASLWPLTGGTLGQFLPNLVELDLSSCLLSRWIEVTQISRQLPWLQTLNISNNHPRIPLVCVETDSNIHHESDESSLRTDFDLDADAPLCQELFSNAFPNLRRFVLVRCDLNWKSLCYILQWTPALKSLAVAYNHLGNVPSDLPDNVANVLRQLINLDLTETGITDSDSLFRIIGPSETLDCLQLNQNDITTFPDFPVSDASTGVCDRSMKLPVSVWFPNLTSLGIRQTQITSWKTFGELLKLPNFNHLLFSSCPVTGSINLETTRQEVIARLPMLRYLNRIEVTNDERRGAELDYLKRYGAIWHSTGGATVDMGDKDDVTMNAEFAAEHPVFARLCKKLGAPDRDETRMVSQALKEGLIDITFVLQYTTPNSHTNADVPSISRRIHGRITVNHMKMMVRRLFKLSPRSGIELIAQGERHKAINAEVPFDADTREVGFYCLEKGDVIFVRVSD